MASLKSQPFLEIPSRAMALQNFTAFLFYNFILNGKILFFRPPPAITSPIIQGTDYHPYSPFPDQLAAV
jgi:hypothetical protein